MVEIYIAKEHLTFVSCDFMVLRPNLIEMNGIIIYQEMEVLQVFSQNFIPIGAPIYVD